MIYALFARILKGLPKTDCNTCNATRNLLSGGKTRPTNETLCLDAPKMAPGQVERFIQLKTGGNIQEFARRYDLTQRAVRRMMSG